MSTSLQTIEAEALKLSAEDRAALGERLLLSVVPTQPLHPAWDAEIERRLREVDEGNVQTVPFDEVMAALKAKYQT